MPAPSGAIPAHKPFRAAPPEAVRIPVRLADVGKWVIKGTAIDTVFDGLAEYRNDPLGFVKWAFPWGRPGTPLENDKGPEPWQSQQLDRIGTRLRAGGPLGAIVEEDISSGHGIGKSAQVAWLILWAISTHEDTRGVVTANTDTQLRTKTWAELSKWYQMFIAREFFELTATALFIRNDRIREKAWRIDAVPWSENNTEAFAGMHNKGKRVLVLFDEASTIADLVYEVTRGALTDANTQIIWSRYGNPTRTSGEFFKACTQPRRNTYNRVDAREVSFTNKALHQIWAEDYGDDSDFFRVRVKGMFPRAGYANFISPELVTQARRRRISLATYQPFPKVLSIDPARFGDDFTVITLRQGLKVHWQVKLSGFDGVDLGGRVFEMLRGDTAQAKASRDRHDATGVSCIVYDAVGNGADLDSTLRRIAATRGQPMPPLIPVMWGQPAKDSKQYFNQRSEAWGKMRDFLETGEIPDDDELADQLTSLDYGHDGLFRIQLQSKKDLKKNGGKSPDCADSLALSFIPELIDRKVTSATARPVRRRTVVWSR